MKRVRISVMRMASYPELMARYENPLDHPCDLRLGQVFETDGRKRPDGLCESAWQTLLPFVTELARGGGNFFGAWMKDPHTAMLSCNDGFRPVSFFVETMEEPL